MATGPLHVSVSAAVLLFARSRVRAARPSSPSSRTSTELELVPFTTCEKALPSDVSQLLQFVTF